MYQPYSGTRPSAVERPPKLRQPPVPAVLNAVRLMYAGMAVNVISVIIAVTIGISKSTIHKDYPHLSPSGLNSTVAFVVTFTVVSGLISSALWLFIALACRKGKNWARLLGSVLFFFDNFRVLLLIAGDSSTIKLFNHLGVLVGDEAVIWLIGLSATVLLWWRGSSAFFIGSPPAPAEPAPTEVATP